MGRASEHSKFGVKEILFKTLTNLELWNPDPFRVDINILVKLQRMDRIQIDRIVNSKYDFFLNIEQLNS